MNEFIARKISHVVNEKTNYIQNAINERVKELGFNEFSEIFWDDEKMEPKEFTDELLDVQLRLLETTIKFVVKSFTQNEKAIEQITGTLFDATLNGGPYRSIIQCIENELDRPDDEVITVDGVDYVISEEDIAEGDLMLVNNPHHASTLKNVIRKCRFVENDDNGNFGYSWFNITNTKHNLGHDSAVHPKSMCKKVVKK